MRGIGLKLTSMPVTHNETSRKPSRLVWAFLVFSGRYFLVETTSNSIFVVVFATATPPPTPYLCWSEISIHTIDLEFSNV